MDKQWLHTMAFHGTLGLSLLTPDASPLL